MSNQRGFTLLELIAVLAIAGIVLTMAVPSFSVAMKNNSIAIQTNNLIADINLARSEAINRGRSVMICRSADPGANPPVCGGSVNDWSGGWLIFASGDSNTQYDTATDTLLRVTDLNPEKGVTVISNATANTNLEYRADGSVNQGGNTSLFAICDPRGKDFGKQIQISPTGRPRLVSPVPVSCTSPSV
ncbi:MAG: GspH/FimT family pseudopilin [Gammaproteobacteria bacterium]|nr:GspH/FimT family pseudopilin [Gammaproteobacteria bacterium]MDH5803093.1 GspH/FimT family pseudopilin [Gammaproteobacteria bacterium]